MIGEGRGEVCFHGEPGGRCPFHTHSFHIVGVDPTDEEVDMVLKQVWVIVWISVTFGDGDKEDRRDLLQCM